MALYKTISGVFRRQFYLSPLLNQRWMSQKPPGGPVEPEGIKEPFIPPYKQKVGEPIDMKRARLMYQSRKRGMLENCLLLSTFAHKYLKTMTAPQLELYDRLINLPSDDWEIYYWTTGVKPVPEEFDNEIMHMLIEFVKNDDRENRTRQPELY